MVELRALRAIAHGCDYLRDMREFRLTVLTTFCDTCDSCYFVSLEDIMQSAKGADQEAAVIYARVSTDRQAEEGISLDMQVARCMEYAEKKGLTVIDTVIDAGISAKTIAGRSGFERILDMVKHHKVAHVLTYKLDRAFRNTGEGLEVLSTMQKKGTELHIVDRGETVQTAKADDEFLWTLQLSLAQRERKLVSERTKVALARKRERSEYCGGEPPYGYQRIEGALVPDLEEQKVIAKIRRLRRKGYSIRRIVACLREDGHLNRRGKYFQKTQVERILAREAA